MDIKQFQARLKKENPDLYKYVLKRKLKKIVKIILFDLAFLIILYFTISEMNRPNLTASASVLGILFCIVFSVYTKPRGLIFGKSWCATIEKKYEQNVKENEGFVGIYTQFENVRYVFLEVREEDGEVKTLRFPAHSSRGYDVGDRIAFYNGLHFPIVVDTSQKEKIVCSRCGAINDKSNTACVDCDSSFFHFS